MHVFRSRSAFGLRRLLLSGTTSVLALALVAPAGAATFTVSGTRTTPIDTANALGAGSAADIIIPSGSAITLPSGIAVTVNSDNTVTNTGTITLAQAPSDVGILLTGAHLSTITNDGTITLSAPTDPTITDYADGGAGIRLASGSALTGDIVTGGTSLINVTGDSAAGIDILGSVTGNVNLQGVISLKGANSSGLNVGAPVSGDVTVTAINVQGVGSRAITVGAPVGGQLKVLGAVNSSGFDHLVPDTTVGPTNYNATQATKIGGPTIAIGADIAHGVLLNGPSEAEVTQITAGTFVGTPTVRSLVNQYGSKPVIDISPTLAVTPANIHLGVVGAGVDAFGLVSRAGISATGIYDGVSTEAIRIEGATISGTTYTTTVDGGFRNEFTIGSIAQQANATGLVIGASATVPAYSAGQFASLNARSVSAINTTATALLLESGASMSTIDNVGTISSVIIGPTGSAYAIRDQAGSLTTINNSGRISAQLQAGVDGTVPSGQAVAIDVSAAAGPVTLTNFLPSFFDPSTMSPEGFGRIVGDIKFGSSGDTFNQVSGLVTGNIDFGGGNNTFSIASGLVTGGAAFGSGADAFAMTGGAFIGTVTDAGGGLTITDTNGFLGVANTGQLNVTNATFSSGSTFSPAVDLQSSTTTLLNSPAGEIRFETGSHLSLQFPHLGTTSFTGVLLQAPTLTIQPSLTDLVSASVPYLYNVSFDETSGGGLSQLNVHLSVKTPAQLGLPANWIPALDPMLEALSHDDAMGRAFLTTTNQADFQAAFSQLLPLNTDAVFEMTRDTSLRHSRVMRERALDLISGGRTGGVWGQEDIHSFTRKGTTDPLAYNGQGLMTTVGLDDYIDYGTVFGLSLALDHSTFDESRVSGAPVDMSHYIGGLYLGAAVGNLVLSASASGAYQHNTQDRAITIANVTRTVSGAWNGSYYSGDFSASYLARIGLVGIRPEAGIEYLRTFENAYQEAGGADASNSAANGVALSLSSRSEQSVLSHLGMTFSLGDTSRHDESAANYNPRLGIVPELELGWVHDFTSDPVKTSAHYINETTQFTMVSDKRLQDLIHADLSLALVTDFGEVRVRIGGSFGDGTTAINGGISAGASF